MDNIIGLFGTTVAVVGTEVYWTRSIFISGKAMEIKRIWSNPY